MPLLAAFSARYPQVLVDLTLSDEVADILGGQADVRGVAGTWKDLTDNVNELASNLTVQLRDVASGAIVSGSDGLSEAVEIWTFSRENGGEWQLSAIQDA